MKVFVLPIYDPFKDMWIIQNERDELVYITNEQYYKDFLSKYTTRYDKKDNLNDQNNTNT